MGRRERGSPTVKVMNVGASAIRPDLRSLTGAREAPLVCRDVLRVPGNRLSTAHLTHAGCHRRRPQHEKPCRA